MPVMGEAAVVRLREWQCTQPTLSNSAEPRVAAADKGAGVGGADRRMKFANCTMSEVPPSLVEIGSSGVGLKTQPGTAERSLVKPSLLTPCSTLYASPAKKVSDLFCAFQPNLVTVPSLPLVLRRPLMPSAALAEAFAA